MSAVRRNGPCGCGSGKKAKRCCGVQRGPSERELAKAFLAQHITPAAVRLAKLDVDELEPLWDEMVEIPTIDVSVQVPLPRFSSPALEELRAIFSEVDPDPDDADDAVERALPLVDTPEVRADMVRAVTTLAQTGRVDPDVAAVAILDLTTNGSAFMKSSLAESVAVITSAVPTPSGLLVVSR